MLVVHPIWLNYGCILAVSLEFPEELYSLHNSHPLVAENLCVTTCVLSPYCRSINKYFDINSRKIKKLISAVIYKMFETNSSFHKK